jgi:cysteine synthase A
LAGCSRALKQRCAETQVIAMEPAEAALLAGEEACCHWIEGISGGFVPPLLQGVAIDRVVRVASPEAIAMTLRLNREHGLLVGSSSGANVAAALQVALSLGEDACVVTLLCDRAERYFSTRLFA